MVVRIPQALVVYFPFILFVGEVILVLTVGPRLISKSRAKRNLPATPLASRVGRCFAASILAILAWMGMLFLTVMLFAAVAQRNEAIGITVACVCLIIISAVTFFITARVCAEPMEDPRKVSRRRRYFIAPGLLVLICIWVFWAVFAPWLGFVRKTASKAVDRASLYGLGNAIELYHSEYGDYPERLGQLIETKCASPKYFFIYAGGSLTPSEYEKGKPYFAPKEFHYVWLPENAPDDLLQVWVTPTLYEGESSPVLYKDGRVEWLRPEEVAEGIGRTYEWLLKNHRESKNLPRANP